jgi:hypothetical protein
MSNPWFPSLRNVLCACSATLIFAVVLTAAPPAHAGFGDLVKKAKDKATKKEEVQEEAAPAGDDQVVFDAYVLELTEQRLGNIVSAYKARPAEGAREGFVEKVTKLETERSDFLDKNGEKIRAVEQKRDEVDGCIHHGYKVAEERRMKEYAERALTDPALLAKYSRVAQENNAKIAQGDSAAIKRANQAIIEEMVPTREDSLAVQRQCGPVPPPLPAETALAKLDKDLAAANDNLRAYDKKVADTQAETSGMNGGQFATALERIRSYLGWRGSSRYKRSATRGYSEEEIEALERRLAELRAALK